MSKERIILERRYVPKGTIVIKEGEEAYAAFLIQSGTVQVYQERDGKQIELSVLGMGEICGEMALINNQPRAANVVTLEDCNLVVITRSAFEEKLKNTDATIQAVVKMLINRVQNSNKYRVNNSN